MTRMSRRNVEDSGDHPAESIREDWRFSREVPTEAVCGWVCITRPQKFNESALLRQGF